MTKVDDFSLFFENFSFGLGFWTATIRFIHEIKRFFANLEMKVFNSLVRVFSISWKCPWLAEFLSEKSFVTSWLLEYLCATAPWLRSPKLACVHPAIDPILHTLPDTFSHFHIFDSGEQSLLNKKGYIDKWARFLGNVLFPEVNEPNCSV